MNVQNIPRDDKVVKRAFIPKLDLFFFCDYPNIELKVLAYYLNMIGFPEMAEFFRDDPDGDLHKVTAAGMYGIPVSEVTDEQRQKGKRCNFSIVYGGGTPTLVRQKAARDFQEASEMLNRFHRTWPGIGWESKVKRNFNLPEKAAKGTLLNIINDKLDEQGYIKTTWGRHLHPRSRHSALNALIQGDSTGDLMKWAMVEVHRYLKVEDMRSHIVNNVHDELMLDATEEELGTLAVEVPKLMTYEPMAAVVPITPSPDISRTTWADKEPYDPNRV